MLLCGSRVVCLQDLTKTLCHLGLDPDALLPQLVPNILECQRAEAELRTELQPPTWMHQLHSLAGTILASPRRLRDAISPTGRRSRKHMPSALGKASSPLRRSPGPSVSDGSSDEGSLHAPGLPRKGLPEGDTQKAAAPSHQENGSPECPGCTIPVGTYRYPEPPTGDPAAADRRGDVPSSQAAARSDSGGASVSGARDGSSIAEKTENVVGNCGLPAQPSSAAQTGLTMCTNSDVLDARPPVAVPIIQGESARHGTAGAESCTASSPDCSADTSGRPGERNTSGAGRSVTPWMNGKRDTVEADEARREAPTGSHVDADAGAASSGTACEGVAAPRPDFSGEGAEWRPRSSGLGLERERSGNGAACGSSCPMPPADAHCPSPRAHRKSLDLGVPTLWDTGPGAPERGRPNLPVLRRRSSFPWAHSDGLKHAPPPPATDPCSPPGTPGSPLSGWDALPPGPHQAAMLTADCPSAGGKTLESVRHAGPANGCSGASGRTHGRAGAPPGGTAGDGALRGERAAGSGIVEDAGACEMEMGSRSGSGGDEAVVDWGVVAPGGMHLTFAAFKRLVYRESVDGAQMQPSSPTPAFKPGRQQVRC